jgi:hypothetical protein
MHVARLRSPAGDGDASMTEPKIFAEVAADLEHGWDAFTAHLHHRHYHQDQSPATPATEAPMTSFVTEIEGKIHEFAASARQLEEELLPGALATARQLESVAGNPVVTRLASAIGLGVPMEWLHGMLLPIIDAAVQAYGPDTTTATPAAPAAPATPAAAPAA